jgi:hypothetical protein
MEDFANMDERSDTTIGELQRAALAELAARAATARRRLSDLRDCAHGGSLDASGLIAAVDEADDIGHELARLADGYREVHPADILYAEVFEDLASCGWLERPLGEVPPRGFLPPVPLKQLGTARGYARLWKRGAEWITIWFSAPSAIVCALTEQGALYTLEQICAAIGSGVPPVRCGADGMAAGVHVDVCLWEPADFGCERLAGRKQVPDVLAEIVAIVGRHPVGADEYLRTAASGAWPEGQIAVRVTASSNEGGSGTHYVCVDVLDGGRSVTVIEGKTLCGRDAAWGLARRLADLLGA